MHALIYAAPPGSAVFHAVEQGWTTDTYQLANVIDLLAIKVWQSTEGAHKRPARGQPEPVERPSEKTRKKNHPDGGTDEGQLAAVGTTAATVTTVEKFMAMREARQRRYREEHGLQQETREEPAG